MTEKPKLSQRGRRILESALKAMRVQPESFNMDDWIQHDPKIKSTKKVSEPYCGTVACLAGHVALVATKKLPWSTDSAEYSIKQLPAWLAKKAATRKPDYGCGCSLCNGRRTVADVSEVAVLALGLDEDAAETAKSRLFHMTGWPNHFTSLLFRAANPKERVNVAIRRVRHWLKTGE